MEPLTISSLPERDLTSTAVLTSVIILAAATMTFGALIAVFFIRSQAPRFWGPLEIPLTLWLTTALLLLSSATLESGRRALSKGNQKQAYKQFAITFGLGAAFLLGQVVAWIQVIHSGVVLKNNPHSWFIFLFIALHGLHILLGLAGTGAVALRTHEHRSGPRYQAKTRAIALGSTIFWHYLGFLWIVLFGLLLFWRR